MAFPLVRAAQHRQQSEQHLAVERRWRCLVPMGSRDVHMAYEGIDHLAREQGC